MQGDTPTPRRSAETLVEGTYQAVLAPGIALQPTLHPVVHPGGGITNPRDPDGNQDGVQGTRSSVEPRAIFRDAVSLSCVSMAALARLRRAFVASPSSNVSGKRRASQR